MQQKHTLPVMLTIYRRGAVSTSELIRQVHGHPGTVIRTVRVLERSGLLSRVRRDTGRHPIEARLTVKGVNLVETPLCRWPEVIREWDRS